MTKLNKEGWEIKKLPEIAAIQYGYAFDSKCFTDDSSQMPLIRIRDVVRGYSETFYNGDYPEGYEVRAGDLLIGMDGEFNIAHWQSRDALLNQRVCKLSSSSEDVSEQYLYYFMKVCLKVIEDETPFVTVKHLSAKRLNQVSVSLPPLPIQQRIVEELDEINAIISAKKQQLSKLDELAQSIFYNMFGDPVTNEKGWEVKKYGEVFEIGSGGTPSKSKPEYWDKGNIPWIGSNMCQNCFIHETDGKFITEEGLNHSSAKLLEPNTVLVALVGATIGKTALLKTATSTNQNVAFIKTANNKAFTSEFVFFNLTSLYEEFMNIGNGDFKMANLSFVRNLPLIIPPLSLQETFAARVSAIEDQKAAIAASIEKMQTLLDARMQEYFG